MVTVKGRSRPIIMYGKNQQHKELWVRDLKHVLWTANGRKGPDPSLSPSTQRASGGTQQPSAVNRGAGKDAKSQQRSNETGGGGGGGRTLYYPDDNDDDFNEQPSDDDSSEDEEQAEVEFMNIRKENKHQQQAASARTTTEPDRSRDTEQLAHGLDSLIFDPFSDFIPPTASPSMTSSYSSFSPAQAPTAATTASAFATQPLGTVKVA